MVFKSLCHDFQGREVFSLLATILQNCSAETLSQLVCFCDRRLTLGSLTPTQM